MNRTNKFGNLNQNCRNDKKMKKRNEKEKNEKMLFENVLFKKCYSKITKLCYK